MADQPEAGQHAQVLGDHGVGYLQPACQLAHRHVGRALRRQLAQQAQANRIAHTLANRPQRTVAVVERDDEPFCSNRGDGGRQSKKQKDSRADDASIGEGELVDHQHRQHREGQRQSRGDCHAAGQREQPKALFNGTQILAQPIQRFHAASSLWDRLQPVQPRTG